MSAASRLVALVFGPLVAPRTYRRWVYLILGGALFVPFVMIGMVVVPSILPKAEPSLGWFWLVAAVAMGGALVAVAFAPPVRVVEVIAVRELLTREVDAGVRPLPANCARWFVAHVLTGTVISLITLLVPAWLVLSFVAPFQGSVSLLGVDLRFAVGWTSVWVPVAGLASVVLLTHLVLGVSAVLERYAPRVLRPSPLQRLQALVRRNDELAERNRLARELHDSVGHALSVVTIQAGAARRVLADDLDFAERALTAIEESARSALEDLDYVLGVLRDDGPDQARGPTRTLRGLSALLQRIGVDVALDVQGDPTAVPPAVSREAYRIVQECLTNVLRHAGKVPVDLAITVGPDRLEIKVGNPVPSGSGPARLGGGRGLRGMRERVTLLGGTLEYQVADGQRWQVEAGIPLRTGRVGP